MAAARSGTTCYNSRVQEVALAGLLLASLALATVLSPETGLAVGLGAIGIGMALSVPTGWQYHVKLARTVGVRGELPPRWWWNPTAHHHKMTAEDRQAVMPWFVAGALGFALAMVGCGVGLTALVRLL